MKKKVWIIILIVLIICLLYPKDKDNLRVRVIANSNDKIDQIYKNEVVSIMKNIIDCDDTYDEVINKFDELSSELDEYARRKELEINVKIGKTKFPTKSLNGKIIQGGIYDTLLITIGKGEGNNYWSLLYPEYYGITFEEIESDNIEVKFYFYEKLKMIFE